MTGRDPQTATARTWRWEQLSEGTTAGLLCHIEPADLDAFIRLSGDHNPLHTDREFAVRQGFRDRVVHGALLGALVSRFIGMELPGRDAMLLSLDLRFAAPTYPGDAIEIVGTVVSLHASQRALVVQLDLHCGPELRARGKALVRVAQDSE
jgi:acyl dehydratase